MTFAKILDFMTVFIRKGFSGARYLIQTSEWQKPNPEQPEVQ